MWASEPSLNTIDAITHRLHSAKKGRIRPEKTANDALISDLPSETIRWIKKRRNAGSEKKVVLSHHRERMLREIFNGIDVGKNGVIDLKQICGACEYVQYKLRNVKGLEQFRDIQAVFRGMDDNGDGTIDFHEFTQAMSGSSDSAFENISELNLDKLYKAFVEYGIYAHRKKVNAKLINYMGYDVTEEAQKRLHSLPTNYAAPPSSSGDASHTAECYAYFKTLFGNEGNTFAKVSAEKAAEERRALRMAEKIRVENQERFLDKFILENKNNPETALADPHKETAYHLIQDKLKEYRKVQLQMKAEDPDAVAQEVRMLEEKKYTAQQGRTRRPGTAPAAARPASRPSTAPSAVILPGVTTAAAVAPTAANVVVANSALDSIKKTTVAPVTLVPIELNTRGDQQLRLTAKKEAYDIIKRTGSHSPRGNSIHPPPRGCSNGRRGGTLYSEGGSEGDSLVYSPSLTSSQAFQGGGGGSLRSTLWGSSSVASSSRASSAHFSYVEPFVPLHTMENYHHN